MVAHGNAAQPEIEDRIPGQLLGRSLAGLIWVALVLLSCLSVLV